MANTYSLISSYEAGAGGAASLDFTNIPAIYTDLCLRVSLRAYVGTGQQGLKIEINGTDTNQSRRILYTDNGSTLTTYNDSSPSPGWVLGTTIASGAYSFAELYFPNYTTSSRKSYQALAASETGAASANLGVFAMNWAGSAPISRLTVKQYSGNLEQYSTAYLYGIKSS